MIEKFMDQIAPKEDVFMIEVSKILALISSDKDKLKAIDSIKKITDFLSMKHLEIIMGSKGGSK